MKTVSPIKLQEILRLHKLWVEGDTFGERANLNCVDLSGSNLRGAYLRGANLSGVNLSGANLRYVIGNSKEIRTLQLG